jgi:hypothetical protein
VDKLWITVGKSRFYVDIFIAKEERGMALRNTSLMALFYPQSKSFYQQEKWVSKGVDQHFSYFSTAFGASYYDYLYKSSCRGGELLEKSLTSRRIRIKGSV